MTFKTSNQQQTIYWHDYETWGASPQKDRPSQFAGIRTDCDLNIIGEPLVIYCRLADDYLPHPQAALITGIKPQVVQQKGLVEVEFIRQILAEFSQPNTCVAGYNNIRFDDEVTRYTLYRNFFDPYAREWQNGNSRWDIIDMVRACHALRPEGINWPLREDGFPSFKLEDLTKANGISHESAHDALSDVIATIEVAKLIKERQPKLFEYLFTLRSKREVESLIDIYKMTPVVHVSSMFSAEHGCTSWVAPLAYHQENKNAVICYDLMRDPRPLLALSCEEIRQKLYSKTEDLAEGEERVGLKMVHINKCPVIAKAKTLKPEDAQRLNIPREQCLLHLDVIRKNPLLKEKLIKVFDEAKAFEPNSNPDYGLYSGGFASSADKTKFDMIHRCEPHNLAALNLEFDDPRFNVLFFRFKARNYPQMLTADEQVRWQQYRTEKLMNGLDSPNLTMQEFGIELENLAHDFNEDNDKMTILKALYDHVQQM